MLRRIVSLALLTLSGSAFAAPAWVAKSDAYTRQLMLDNAKYVPESASNLGLEQFDTSVMPLKEHEYERQLADTQKRLEWLRQQRTREPDAKVRQDLDILIAERARAIDTMKLEHQYLLNYLDVSETVFDSLRSLLDPRNKPERQKAALVRLRRYVGREPGYQPLAALARARAQEELGRKGLIGPYVEEVEQALNNSTTYMDGLDELFRAAKLTGFEDDLAALKAQVKDYNAWVRAHILPRARKTVQLPPAIYADRLRNVGVDISPDELIERASFDFQEIRDEMQVVANTIAAQRKLPSSNYRDVLRALKQEQVAPGELLPYYRTRLKEIESIIRQHNIVTLPVREASVRMATNAEAARSPAPYMSPPRLIGNTGEYGEFVVPATNPNAKSKERMNDFDFAAMAWTLIAHEGRPGHELQFASIVEQGMSSARAIYAFNSANVEGWGLFSEAMVLPYMPPEGQLASLQARLLRMARALLDPQVNLGRMTPEAAKRFLMQEVGSSEPFAQSEVDRYSYRSPGQATAYYYGYVKLRALKTQAEILLGERFSLKAFNDFVISQGILPPELMRKAVLEEFVPAQLAAAKPH
jgi:hypothetical protein